MARGRIIHEQRWKDSDSSFTQLAAHWSNDATIAMLRAIWLAYDDLCKEILLKIESLPDGEELERTLVEAHYLRIQRRLSGDEPYQICHECFEWENRPSRGRPKQYDMAFVLNANERIKWPIETKVLMTDEATDEAIAKYVEVFEHDFMTFRKAPFSTGAAVIAYLRRGDAGRALSNISAALKCKLALHVAFPERHHRISDHSRTVPTDKPYPSQFRCHHLIMLLMVQPAQPAQLPLKFPPQS